MLAIPAFQARTQTALFRANNKPPLEVVVANLVFYYICSLRHEWDDPCFIPFSCDFNGIRFL